MHTQTAPRPATGEAQMFESPVSVTISATRLIGSDEVTVMLEQFVDPRYYPNRGAAALIRDAKRALDEADSDEQRHLEAAQAAQLESLWEQRLDAAAGAGQGSR